MYDWKPWLLKVWVPTALWVSMAAVALIEARIAYGYATGT